ncbi:MAG: hypothetical protein H6741_01620 [Alphaproteobacteria bacterium]|nr:hypothetical protein [Alphaproteobacteria bacterium]
MSDPFLDYWRPFRVAFNPTLKGLPLDQLDALYAEPPLAPALPSFALRIHEWTNNVSLGRDDTAPPRLLLVGARGSGKSTQLHRAATLLSDTAYPVVVDLSPALVERMGTLPLIIHAGLAGLAHLTEWAAHGEAKVGMEAIRQAAGEARGLFADAMRALDMGANLADSLGDLLAAASIVLTQVPVPESQIAAAGAAAGSAAGKGMGKGFLAIRRATTALRGVGSEDSLATALGQNAVQQARPMLDAVNQIYAALYEANGHRHPVLLMEGMDKAATVGDAFALLKDDALFAELAFPTALTGSIALHMRLEFNNLSDVFKLETVYTQATRQFESTATSRAETLEYFQALVQQRIAHYGVPHDIVADAQLKKLALASSGLTAEFIKLLDDAATFAMTDGARTLRDQDVEQAIFRLRNAIATPLTEAHWSLLQKVMESKEAPEPSDGALGQELLYRNDILCYRNGRPWYWPHEVLIPYLMERSGKHGDHDDH